MTHAKARTGRGTRIELIDLARGIALAAMAVYHFTWDMEFFGYVEAGTAAEGGWKFFARGIASSFLFLVGVSLVLAHGRGVRWPGFGRRLAMIVAAAAVISLATFIAVPEAFIFFGILHQIALASLVGLLFVRLPWSLTLLAAAAVIAAPHFLRSDVFNQAGFWPLGLSTEPPRSNDYVPVFPWFGAVLAGMAAAAFAARTGLLPRLAGIRVPRPAHPLVLAGRHSLAFYLIHQPVLIGCLWLFSQAFPPEAESLELRFLRSCETSCLPERDIEFCTRYCACVLDTLDREDLEGVAAGSADPELRLGVEEATRTCSAETDRALQEGGLQ